MKSVNYGVCSTCRKRVPADHAVKDGRVYLVKHCPDCGATEALVSTNAARWQRKREICQYDPDEPLTCSLHCKTCRHEHNPRMVFLDVTNRCNMNCPICIANIPSMGFEFHPPISYFERVLKALGERNPKPSAINLFGGEPTVRDDLFEIIEITKRNGLSPRVVTNGLRLADEDYCRRLCATGAQVLIAFDGRDPAIYERLRKSPGAYTKKLKALENLSKYSDRKTTLMCCVARGINDKHLRDLIDFCHENRSFIKCMHLIPLTETWEQGEFETDIATTTEDVEQIVADAFPEGEVEFLPMGPSAWLKRTCDFFGAVPLKFGGIHPNCETATYLLSDGTRYRPFNDYLKIPLDELGAEIVTRCKRIEPKLARLDPAKWGQRWRGRLTIIRAFAGLAVRALNTRMVLKGNRLLALLRIAGGMMLGRKFKDVLRANSNVQSAMLMVILPFEEYHSVESARLENCPSAFAYEDPETGEVRTVPVCMWGLHKNDVQRRIAGVSASVERRPTASTA